MNVSADLSVKPAQSLFTKDYFGLFQQAGSVLLEIPVI